MASPPTLEPHTIEAIMSALDSRMRELSRRLESRSPVHRTSLQRRVDGNDYAATWNAWKTMRRKFPASTADWAEFDERHNPTNVEIA